MFFFIFTFSIFSLYQVPIPKLLSLFQGNFSPGSSFLNGGVGGTCNYGAGVAHGGFGGGGGGTWWSMGGAGGGYQGGSTISGYGNSSGPQTAYSYNTGSNTSGSQDGTQQTAADSLMHGYVIITW